MIDEKQNTREQLYVVAGRNEIDKAKRFLSFVSENSNRYGQSMKLE